MGGCRAVVSSNRRVGEVAKLYQEARAKNPHKGPQLEWANDYITSPKKSGYRSYHLIFQYHSNSPKHECFNGHRIEIQLRSLLQHAWATAVETVDAFTEQHLKSSLGDDRWRRFFALMGSAIALREGAQLVPGTPTKESDLLDELRAVEQEIRAKTILEQLQVAARYVVEIGPQRDTVACLLTLDTIEEKLEVMRYTAETVVKAPDDYLAKEKEIAGSKGIQAVLVSVDRVTDLRKAYPNYYVDLGLFLRTLRQALGSDRVRYRKVRQR